MKASPRGDFMGEVRDKWMIQVGAQSALQAEIAPGRN